MTLEIVKVDPPKELAAEQVNAVRQAFRPHFDAMAEIEPRYVALTELKLVEPTKEQCAEARSVRLMLAKTRTGTAKTHKELKAEALVFGRYLDGMKKAQELACEKREADMEAIEKHYENVEKERMEKLQFARESLLRKLGIDVLPSSLGEMEENVWDMYYDGVYQDVQRRKEDEKKAEDERIAKEKAEAEEHERIRIENEKLKAEAIERERMEAERRKVEAEEKARFANKKHRQDVENRLVVELSNIGVADAEKIVAAIHTGHITLLTINY